MITLYKNIEYGFSWNSNLIAHAKSVDQKYVYFIKRKGRTYKNSSIVEYQKGFGNQEGQIQKEDSINSLIISMKFMRVI